MGERSRQARSGKEKRAMNEFDELNAEILRSEMKKDWTREQAIAYGKALGENEADSRQEVKDAREVRVNRAMAYAAWEYDGKPEGDAHLKEFGVTTEMTGSMERAVFGRLLQKEKS